MNRTSAAFTFVMAACGLLLGYSANRRSWEHSLRDEATMESESARPSSRRHEDFSQPNTPQHQLQGTRSAETLETLVAKEGGATYADIALWLVDADAGQIAAYWESCKDGKLDGDRERLIFLSWTRLDPNAAVAATASTDRAGMAWWAWAASDPMTALASAGDDRLEDVARGIGEFQPKWLMANFHHIPEAVRRNAVGGLLTWKENEDPAATLDFLKEHEFGFNKTLFRTLCLKDPWAAYDWLQKNESGDSKANSAMDTLLETMRSAHPDDLERLGAMAPSGRMKRKVEDFIFASLLEKDPESALAEAKDIEAPAVAAIRLAQVGKSLMKTDPDKAFEVGSMILATGPQNLVPFKQMEFANGTNMSLWDNNEQSTQEFIESLLSKDPARTMEMTIDGMKGVTSTFHSLCGKWCSQDTEAYSAWVDTQKNPEIRSAAERYLIMTLSSQGRFQEAADRATGAAAGGGSTLTQLAIDWGKSDPTAAAAWLESADIDEEQREQLGNHIKSGK
ncbi:MAG: hypothetical protein EOP85_01210 [Verrucomicrobiaceae bacterium]|nr:MAG: hypothetical protein EOP85_01210 [Verrucomicrobiaceae bacterium]